MILVAGSANLDFVVRAARIPGRGETVLGRGFKTFAGGKGANQAIACARAGGAETAMLLALGDDTFAVPIEASLNDAGVHLHIVRVAGEPSGTAFICVADDAENAITVAPGANDALREWHLPSLAGVTHLLMQLETPVETVHAYAKAARSNGANVILNAAPARQLPPELLAEIDMLIVNQGELAIVSAHDGSVGECLERIDVPCVVVTLGADGCQAHSRGGESIRQAAYPVNAIDTTAAGDTFCGALVAALGRQQSLREALRYASAAAALACTRPGAQPSIPTEAETLAFLESQTDDSP